MARTWAVAAAAMCFVTVLEASVTDGVLVIHLEERAGVAPADLDAAKKNVEEIFLEVRVAVAWEAPVRASMRSVSCDGRRHVALTLLNSGSTAAGDDGNSTDVLGRAARPLGRAWVFVDRIARVARRGPVDANLLLARAMAHELAHLLLPSHEIHAAVGLMRAALDLRHIGDFHFNPAQARHMRTALAPGETTECLGIDERRNPTARPVR